MLMTVLARFDQEHIADLVAVGLDAANSHFVRKTAIHAQFNQWLQSIRHSDILTTSRYIDVNSKKLSEAAQRFKHWPLHKAA